MAAPDGTSRNVAFLVGAGYAGEEILRKEPFARHLTGHHVHVASRIDPEVHLRARRGLPVRNLPASTLQASFTRFRSHAKTFEVVYHDEAFRRTYSSEDIRELQAWLGYSFRYIASMDRRFFHPETLRDERDPAALEQAMAAYVAYFRAWFQRHQVDTLVTTLEDDLFSLAPYFVAKRLGLFIVSWQVGRFPERATMLCHDFRELLLWTDEVAPRERFAPLYQDKTTSGEAMSMTRGYWDVANLPKRIRDAYFGPQYSAYRAAALTSHPAEAMIIPPLRLGRRITRHLRKVLRRYALQAFTAMPPTGERYFLYAIHMVEDAQITFREPLLEQFQLIKQIARGLPAGTKLYVKPHPHYYGTDMTMGEISKLARLPNVRILPATVPPGKLVRDAVAVVTVNSTVGFEALFHGTPVVTVGTDFYCQEPETKVVHDRNHLSETLARVHAGTDLPGRAEGDLFVRRAYANTIPIRGSDFGFAFYGYTDEDGQRVAAALDIVVRRSSHRRP